MCVFNKIKWLYVFLAVVLILSLATGVYAKVKADRVKQEMELLQGMEWIIPLGKYDSVEVVDGAKSLYVIGEGEHYGLVNRQGTIILKPQYDYVSNLCRDGLISVSKGSRSGYVNVLGEIVIPLCYEECLPFKNGYGVVSEENRYKVLDEKGKVCYESSNFIYMSEKAGYAILEKSTDAYQYNEIVDIKRKKIRFSPAKGTTYGGYGEGFWLFRADDEEMGEKYTYYDENFQPAFENQNFSDAAAFSGGLAAVMVKEQLAYIDRTGRVIFKKNHSAGGDFSYGLAVVLEGKKADFIYNNGTVAFTADCPSSAQRQVNLEEGFYHGYCLWENKTGKFGYLDVSGKYALPPVFSSGGQVYEGEAAVTYGRQTGVVKLPHLKEGK